MSERLKEVTKDLTKAVFSEDGNDVGFVPTKWEPPARVGDETRDEARKWVQAMSVGRQSAGTVLVQRWLSSLLPFVALKGMSTDQVKIKISAYASQMQTMPEYLFTNASLSDAARFFKWFPDYSDLMEWFEARDREHGRLIERMEIIANGNDDPHAPKPWSKERGESRKIEVGEFVTREMKELIAIMDEKDRLSGWAEKDPRPRITGPLPHEDTPPEMRTRQQEIDRVNALSEHRKLCEAWGNRMRERDLAEIRDRKKGKLNAKG